MCFSSTFTLSDGCHADFSLPHYQKIERGELDPRLATIKRLADAFGITMSELLNGL